MRIVTAICLVGLAACGGKKAAEEVTTPPAAEVAPAEEVAAPAEDAAAKAEDAAAKAEDAAKVDDAAAKADDAAKVDDAAAAADVAAVDPELIKRGEYVAGISGCALCHTAFGPTGPALDKMWGGGLEVPEEVGTWRSPNISQDKKTGIGSWTDQQIIDAVREGKRPDGSTLYPVMPYPFYNRMSDADAKALVAFLRTVPPVDNAVAGNDLKIGKPPVPPATGAEAPADKRGEYLTSLMHCGACHTVMTPQGPDMAKWMAGGTKFEMPMFGEGALYSQNITPHPTTGIGGWTDAEIVASLREMKHKDGAPIMGPMQMYQMGWSKIADADMTAIVGYLRALPPIDNAVPKSTFKPKGPPPEAPAPQGETTP